MWRANQPFFSGKAERALDQFEELARQYGPVVFRYVRMWTGSDTEAEDLTQDAFLRAFERREQLRSRERFLPWMLTIARHTMLNERRRPHRKREVPLEWEDTETGSERVHPEIAGSDDNARTVLARQHLAEMIDDALDTLDAEAKEIFLLRYYGEYKTPEIAEKMKMPLGTVTAKLCRGLKQLRVFLEREGVSEFDVVD